jgi:hypothetical protein
LQNVGRESEMDEIVRVVSDRKYLVISCDGGARGSIGRENTSRLTGDSAGEREVVDTTKIRRIIYG